MSIVKYTNEIFGKLKVILVDGEPWFFAKDICGLHLFYMMSRDYDYKKILEYIVQELEAISVTILADAASTNYENIDTELRLAQDSKFEQDVKFKVNLNKISSTLNNEKITVIFLEDYNTKIRE